MDSKIPILGCTPSPHGPQTLRVVQLEGSEDVVKTRTVDLTSGR